MYLRLLLFLSLIFLASCHHKRDVLSSEISKNKIFYNGLSFYIIEPNDCKIDSFEITLTYYGTIENYHLFITFEKMVYENEINRFAILKESCIVNNIKTPEEIKKIFDRCRSRKSKLINGKIYVEDCQ